MKGLNFALLSSVFLLWFRSTLAFRLLHRGVDLYDDFTSYEISYVGQANNPDVSTLENVLEGAPSTRTHPRNWAPASGRQICPGMIGPLGANAYYCHAKEFGSCDRRAGVCHCNTGYEGVDCSTCGPTHYRDGNLCYPKRSCPGTIGGRFSLECSGAGICNYSTGKCQCHSSTRTGDCSISECMGFDKLCTACTQSYCVGCVDGYYLDENSHSCHTCAHHSQRCAVCNSNSCLKCVDTTVWSHFQPAKPLLTTLESNFGSAAVYATFEIGSSDEYEQFRVLPNSKPPQLCEQGLSGNSSWSCGDSLREQAPGACGHEGTITWSSSQYSVAEGAKTVRVAIKRSGGGIGVVQVRYMLHHITTAESDIAMSAPYTSSTMLQFDDGVTELSFLLAVHDDRMSEGDETAMIELIRPRGGASLGSQRRALLTVIDDDMNRASAFFSLLRSDCIATAGNASSTVILAHNGRGTQMQMGGDVFLVELEPIFFSTTSHTLTHSSALKLPYTEGSNWEISAMSDMGNGTYFGSWIAKRTGIYKQRAWMLATGGLKGEYHHGSNLMAKRVVDRIDSHVHFMWDSALLQKAYFPPSTFGVDLDFVRWSGHLRPSRTGAYYLHVVLHGSGLGVRLWLDGRVLVDGWRTLTRRHSEISTPALLTAYHLHSIALELRISNNYYSDFDASRGKGVSLEWSAASMSRALIAPKYLHYSNELKGSPSLVRVASSALSTGNTFAFGSGLSLGEAGRPLAFQVLVVDLFGNRCDDVGLSLPIAAPARPCDAASSRLRALGHRSFLGLKANASLLRSEAAARGGGMFPVAFSIATHAGLARTRHARGAHPTQSGAYQLAVSYESNLTQRWIGVSIHEHADVFGSPFQVKILPARAHARQCSATGQGLHQGTAGAESRFTIQSFDEFRNRVDAGGDVIAVVSKHVRRPVGDLEASRKLSPRRLIVTGNIYDAGNGTYHASVRPVTAGTHKLAVMINGQAIRGSPFSLHVLAGPARGQASTADGLGIQTATVHVLARFLVNVRDQYGNLCVENIDMSLLSCKLDLNADGACNLQFTNGSVLCTYFPTISGSLRLEVAYAGEMIRGSPFLVHVEDGVTSTRSTVAGDGLTRPVAGKTSVFTLAAHDTSINIIDEPPLKSRYNATLTHESYAAPFLRAVITGAETSAHDGIYDFEYNATLAGQYTLLITDTISASNISRLSLYVTAGDVDASKCSVEGLGIAMHVHACQVAQIRVSTRDSWGNLHFNEVHQLLAVFVGGGGDNGSKKEERQETLLVNGMHIGPGLYGISYFARISGAHRLHLFLRQPGIDVSVHNMLDPRQVLLVETAAEIDYNWNRRYQESVVQQNDTFRPAGRLANTKFIAIFVAFLQFPRSAEDFLLRCDTDPDARALLKIDGRVIFSSSSTYEGVFSPSPSSLRRDHVFELTYAHASGPMAFVRCSWASKERPELTRIPSASFSRTALVGTSPILFDVIPGFPDGSASRIIRRRQEYQVANWSPVAVFEIRDSCANLRARGGDHPAIYLDAPREDISTVVTDLKSGLYEALVYVKAVRKYTITAYAWSPQSSSATSSSARAQSLIGAPWTADFVHAAASKHSTLLVGTALVAGVTAGTPAHLILHEHAALSHIDWNKNISVSLKLVQPHGISNVRAWVADSSVRASRSLRRGRLMIRFILCRAGIYQLRVFLNGSILGVPVALQCRSGHMSASWSGVRDEPLGRYIVKARDEFGNSIPVGGEAVRIRAQGSGLATGIAHDSDDGTYFIRHSTFDLNPHRSGSHLMHIDLAHKPSIGRGGGSLMAHYFTDGLSGLPSVVREEFGPLVFDWAQEDIAVGVADYTSIRWTGLLESPESAQFRLELGLLDPDDAARIFIDETVVVETSPGQRRGSGFVYLVRGALHSIIVEFHKSTGPAGISVEWSSPDMAQQPIAACFLYSRWRRLKDTVVWSESLAANSFWEGHRRGANTAPC